MDAPLAAYNIDAACFYFGNWVENKLQETVETGTGRKKKSKPKYKLAQLLDPDAATRVRRQKYAAFDAPAVTVAGGEAPGGEDDG